MEPIIQITDVPHIGQYAKVRPIEPGELVLTYAVPVRGVSTSQCRAGVLVPGLEDISPAYYAEERKVLSLTLFFPEPIKGSNNRDMREAQALSKLGAVAGEPLTNPEILEGLNQKVAERCKRFNETFHEKVERMVGNAGNIWKKEDFAMEHARIQGLRDAVKVVKVKLAEAKDEMHVMGRERLLKYLREQQLEGVLDFDELSKVGRKIDNIFGED